MFLQIQTLLDALEETVSSKVHPPKHISFVNAYAVTFSIRVISMGQFRRIG
jgi:hypothetical protein